MIGFIVGLFVGAFLGVVVMCCFVASKADDEMEQMANSDNTDKE